MTIVYTQLFEVHKAQPNEVYPITYCPNDGFPLVTQDAAHPLIYYVRTVCPVDAYVTAIKAKIDSWVDEAWTGSANVVVPMDRLQAIIASVTGAINSWVQTNAPGDVSNFILGNRELLFGWILASLTTKGITTSV